MDRPIVTPDDSAKVSRMAAIVRLPRAANGRKLLRLRSVIGR